ncbi:hypothetical protein DPMN_141639 [Dreissena polymorpha]|uniref:Uncharacterized protein n=1 Tax=Dreissena polymorpha TaxID=45954 RepID=A0A9D4JMS4_DREPO|nr:hypothetical protein DPMN_141639 [Dreissena polymorpha]
MASVQPWTSKTIKLPPSTTTPNEVLLPSRSFWKRVRKNQPTRHKRELMTKKYTSLDTGTKYQKTGREVRKTIKWAKK